MLAEEMRIASQIFDHLVRHDLFRQMLEEKEKRGMFALLSDPAGADILGFRLGSAPDLRFKDFDFFGHEKVARLGTYPEHVTSRESASERKEDGRFPGAIRCKHSRRGGSGLTSNLDELFSVLWALESVIWRDELTVEQARAILTQNADFARYRLAPNGLWK